MTSEHSPSAKPSAKRTLSWEESPERGPRPVNLEARFENGDGCFLPYAYLVFCRYDQGGIIELHFTQRILRIEGRNLRELFDALTRHAVMHVQEAGSEERLPEAEVAINKLTIVEEAEDDD